MMLHRMGFCLSGKVVALHFDNSTAKAYLCNQGSTVSLFLSGLACQILSLTDKHGITLIPAHIPNHLNVEADYLSQDQMLPEWHLLPQVAQAAFHLWGLPEVDLLASSHSTQHQHNYTLESATSSGDLGVECIQPSLDVSGKLCVSSSCISSSGSVKFLVEHVKGQLRWLILVALCWMEAPWLPTVLNMLADIPQQHPIIKDLIMDI